MKEGSLEAPRREPLDWEKAEFREEAPLYEELERVFDICHGCRRCVSLCQTFPTLFDLVDESETFEVDGVDKADYAKVVDQCFLCDLCAETKCPYLPPHEWAVDFPHLMLRAKAYLFKTQTARWRDRIITSTNTIFKIASKPGVARLANTLSHLKSARLLGQKAAGIHASAPLPTFHTNSLSSRVSDKMGEELDPVPSATTTGKVAVYVTCYGEHIESGTVEDLIQILNHNGIPVKVLNDAQCCGMPKLELGDLDSVAKLKGKNVPIFREAIEDGYDIMSIIPSCTLMYRQEMPLLFPNDPEVKKISDKFFDPFEYLMLRSKENLISTDFVTPLGTIAYHAACHQRVQRFGAKTREFLSLIPETEVMLVERCSGHDGTYAVKTETYEKAMKIAQPVIKSVKTIDPEIYGSDCPMAGRMIQHGLNNDSQAVHPISMVRKAYDI